jgi:hypothetical protein
LIKALPARAPKEVNRDTSTTLLKTYLALIYLISSSTAGAIFWL